MSKNTPLEIIARRRRSADQYAMLIDEIKTSEKYIVWNSIDKKTHIIPDQKLHEMLEVAKEEGKAIGREERNAEILKLLPEEEEPPTDQWEDYSKGYNTCLGEVKALLTPQND